MPPSHSADSPSDFEDLPQVHFRRRRLHRSVHSPLPARELAIATLLSLNLCFLPWAFGGVDLWSQVVAALLGALALAAALWPPVQPGGTRPLDRFLRFPPAWAGLLLFAYVIVQALNTAYAYQVGGRNWWLTEQPHLAWLPMGMDVPFADAGPWRFLLMWFTPWAGMCAAGVGLTRRAAALAVLTAVVANAFLLAGYGLVHRAGGAEAIYGLRRVISANSFSALIYQNHAAAYFNLAATVAAALAVHHYRLNLRQPGRQGPAILFFVFTVTLLLAGLLTYSLSGVLLLAATLLVGAPLTAVRLLRAAPGGVRPAPGLLFAAILLLVIGSLGAVVGFARLRERIAVKMSGGGLASAAARLHAGRQGVAMFRDRPLLGWGAGCFRYGFTKYQRMEPRLNPPGKVQYFWEHVHDDWLELLIELGLVGVLPVLLIAGYWLRELVRRRVWRHPAVLWPALGAAGLALHAVVDFPFQNPAVLVTACVLLPLVACWVDAEAAITGGESAVPVKPAPTPA